MKFFQLELRWPGNIHSDRDGCVDFDGKQVPILYRRNALAKRYRLFVDREGRPRVTIPRRGSQREAQRFLEKHRDWLIGQLQQFETRQTQITAWRPGSEISFRGCLTPLELVGAEPKVSLLLGSESISLPPGFAESDADLRGVVERHLRRLASVELPQRVLELAALHECRVRTISVRNQRSRWGSCSRRGTVSLNWRLVQVPVEVRDYIILHELMHLREMNHSRRFWNLVAVAYPNFKACEAWLRAHSSSLL